VGWPDIILLVRFYAAKHIFYSLDSVKNMYTKYPVKNMYTTIQKFGWVRPKNINIIKM